MINALHLLWIIPLAAMFGFLTCSMLTAAGREDARLGIEREGRNEQ